jgi:two-component system sensor histidine kinase HydH
VRHEQRRLQALGPARWADWGAIAVALLAAIALALTAAAARSDIDAAWTALVRGEGDALLARIDERLRPPHGPPTPEKLAAALADLGPEGLRFVYADVGTEPMAAGTSTIPYDDVHPGDLIVRGERALVVRPLPPAPGGAVDRPVPSPGASPPMAWGRTRLVAEFQPSVGVRVRAGSVRTTAVASVAVLVLLAFAGAFTARVLRRGREASERERQRRLAALGQVSSVMAHELRNPLASLKGHAQLLAAGAVEGTRERAKADLVVREAERLEQLTRELLAFVSEAALDRSETAPSVVIDRALASESQARARVRVSLEDAPAHLDVDAARLALALGNLVRNALQASEDGAVDFTIRAERRERREPSDVVIEVRDHGPGIVPGDEERIFEPFYTTRVRGTGLGLAVARRAVEQHGGTLRASTHEGGGAVFRVTLPGAGRGSKWGESS